MGSVYKHEKSRLDREQRPLFYLDKATHNNLFKRKDVFTYDKNRINPARNHTLE